MNQHIIHTLSSLILALSMFSGGIAYADKVPPLSFSATYKANIKGFAVNASRELKALGQQQYQLSFQAKSWAGNIKETSTFTLEKQQIHAQVYQFTQSALGKKRERLLRFNATDNTITSTHKGETTTISNSDGSALDKLNYQLQLQLDLRAGKNNLHYKIADKGHLRDYRFEILGEETVTTNIGELNTLKVKVIRENKNKVTDIWFATDWDYLLVQLKQYEDDKQKLSITLDTATVNTIAVTGTSHNP